MRKIDSPRAQWIHHPGIRRHLFNTSWLMAEKILRAVAYFAVGILVIRHLGPESYGLLSYAISIMGILSIISAMGLEKIVVTQLTRTPERRNAILGTALALRLAGVGLALAILAVLSLRYRIHDGSTAVIVWIVAGSMLFQSTGVIDAWNQAREQNKYSTICSTGSLLIVSVLRIYGIVCERPLAFFAWLVTAEAATTALLLIAIFWRTAGSPGRWRFDRAIGAGLLRESWPLLFSGLMGSLYMRIDHVMLRNLIGDDAVGQYAAAVKLAEAWYFIPMVISASLAPVIIRSRDVSRSFYRRRLLDLYSLLTFISLAVSAATILCARPVVAFLYGDQYAASSTILIVYVLTGVFVSFGVAKSTWVVLEAQQLPTLAYQSIGTGLNIALNLLWIPRYGAIGAAAATLATVVSNTLIVPVFLNAQQREQTMLFLKSFNPMVLFRHVHRTPRQPEA